MSYGNSAVRKPNYVDDAQSASSEQQHEANLCNCPPSDGSATPSGASSESGDYSGTVAVNASVTALNNHVLDVNAGAPTGDDGLAAANVTSNSIFEGGQLLRLAVDSDGSGSDSQLLALELGSTAQGDSRPTVDVVADVAVGAGDNPSATATIHADAGGGEHDSALLQVNLASDALKGAGDVDLQGLSAGGDDVLAAMIGTQDFAASLLGEGTQHEGDACSGPVDLSALNVDAILGTLDMADCLAA